MVAKRPPMIADFYPIFVQQLLATSYWEWCAVFLAVFYLLLAVKESKWCWPAAFLSTSIYTFLFFDVNLYMESFLNSYYLVMAVYGWNQWNKKELKGPRQNILSWSIKTHVILILSTSLVVVLSAYLLTRYTSQALPLVDSFTTWFAILTTYMVTQKILENWIYWIIIDAVSIGMYLSKGFALTAILFFCYIVIAVIGWFVWKKHYQQQNSVANRPQHA